jgi:hypothetical protein
VDLSEYLGPLDQHMLNAMTWKKRTAGTYIFAEILQQMARWQLEHAEVQIYYTGFQLKARYTLLISFNY